MATAVGPLPSGKYVATADGKNIPEGRNMQVNTLLDGKRTALF